MKNNTKLWIMGIVVLTIGVSVGIVTGNGWFDKEVLGSPGDCGGNPNEIYKCANGIIDEGEECDDGGICEGTENKKCTRLNSKEICGEGVNCFPESGDGCNTACMVEGECINCPSGEVCNGICMKTCKEDSDCDVGKCIEGFCNIGHEDCKICYEPNTICVKGNCKLNEVECEELFSETDCDTLDYCIYDKVIDPHWCVPKDLGKEPGDCLLPQPDCKNKIGCTWKEGVCLNVECNPSDDCPGEEICINGRCKVIS